MEEGHPGGSRKVSVSTIERIERGERVSVEALDRVAEGFGHQAGHFTTPRLRLTPKAAAERLFEALGHLEMVPVRPMRTYRAIREAASCDAVLIHRPDVPATHDADLDELREWLDLTSFTLTTRSHAVNVGLGRRELYGAVLACVHGLERRGLTMLSGVMRAPQDGLSDWTVAIVSATTRLRDPGAPKRRHVMVDTRSVALPTRASPV